MRKVASPAATLLLSALLGITAGCNSGTEATTPGPVASDNPGTSPTSTVFPPAQPPMAAFIQEKNGQRDIYAVTNDGSGLTKVSKQSRAFNSVYVLPDGSKGVFAAREEGGYSQIFYLAPFSSSGTPIQLTTTPGHKTGVMLSADGSRIAFMYERSGKFAPEDYVFDIAVMNSDGTNLHIIPLPIGWSYAHPFFSPDDGEITGAMIGDGCFSGCSVFVVNVDGGNFTTLTPGGADGILAVTPAFSRDGTHVVFSSVDWGDVSLHIMNADGSDLQHLGASNSGWGDPLFVNDRIMFVTNNAIYTMKSDGTGVKRIATDPYTQSFDMSIN